MQNISFYINNPSVLFNSIINRFGTWLPDKQFLKIKFWLSLGYKLNIKNPKTFQEKIQWLKLYNRMPEYTKMVDKYAVKDYVAGIIGKEYIIPTLGVWESTEEIDFHELPNQFVLKTTHAGGGGGVIVCRDKSMLDIESAKQKLDKSLKSDIYKYYREWPYKNVPRRIIAEQLLEIPDKKDLIDYKIYCFNGKPVYIQVIQDRNTKETIDFFDTEWNHQEFLGLLNERSEISYEATVPTEPDNLDEMLIVAEKLAKDTTFVRVDLYNIDSKVYFGELTFYPASCFGKFTPAEWPSKHRDLIQLNDNKQFKCKKKYIVNLDQDIIEKIDDEIRDYKFFCFDGVPIFLKVDFGRFTEHHANYYDMDWNILPFGEAGFPPIFEKKIAKPINFNKMVEIAKQLSKGHQFLRVDLYNILGKIYFGELTFYPASGFGAFTSVKWDIVVGDYLKI